MKKYIHGWWWPESDQGSAEPTLHDVLRIGRRWLPHVRDYSACVQAGGHCGVFPAYLAQHFRAVYTAEPDHENFRCLTLNCAQPNIYPFRAGLGDPGPKGIHRVPHYVASHWIEGDGDIPMVRIDDWQLKSCGLIALDTEGTEFRALKGAENTINRFRPVLVVEDKGHVARFGDTSEAMNAWIAAHGYREHEKIGQDRIWVPQ